MLTPKLQRAALYLTCGSVVSVLFSIAVSQILLALAVAALLMSGLPLRYPPIKLPLAIFIAWTVAALLLSPDPRSGTPQLRKMILFLIPLLVCSCIRTLPQIRTVVLLWGGVAAASAVRSFVQFWQKYDQARELGRSFYRYYIAERITGFTSHWMTFGGEEMIVMLMLGAFILFARGRKAKTIAGVCLGILGVSLVLGLTRSIFLLGLPLGGLYLLIRWNWRALVVVPIVVLAALAVRPVRERAISVFHPHGQLDSNRHRIVTRRTGWEMVKAHPWFGLGPEQIKPQFDSYVPADIPRPLPEGWYGHLHNIYLQYAAERGIPGTLAMMWIIGRMLFDYLAALRRRDLPPGARFVLHGAVASIIGTLAEGFYEYNLGDSEVLTMFLSVTALAYVALWAARTPEQTAGAVGA